MNISEKNKENFRKRLKTLTVFSQAFLVADMQHVKTLDKAAYSQLRRVHTIHDMVNRHCRSTNVDRQTVSTFKSACR